MRSAGGIRVRWPHLAGLVLAVVLAPVLLFVADPLHRLADRRLTELGRPEVRRVTLDRHGVRYLAVSGERRPPFWTGLVFANVVLIALGAPHRWLRDRVSGILPRPRRRRPLGQQPGGDRPPESGPPPAGVREPRRPGPNPPADHIALSEPRE